MHPGSHGNAKEWPERSFIELIHLLEDSNIHAILTGSKEEAVKFKRLQEETSATSAMGECSLKEFIALLSQSDGLLAASTGPIHIASLFGVQTLGLFPKQKEIGAGIWRPLGKRSSYLESSVICDFCIRGLSDFNPTLCTCMQGIDVRSVYSIINQWSTYESAI